MYMHVCWLTWVIFVQKLHTEIEYSKNGKDEPGGMCFHVVICHKR